VRTGAGEGEPGAELDHVGDAAAEADVTVGADDDDARAGDAREPVDRDVGTERFVLNGRGVAVQQDVEPRPGEERVKPGMPAVGGGDGRVREAMAGARASWKGGSALD